MAATAIAYRMKNDIRAKKVLKDLSRILKEAGVETKHARLQDAVAGLFGYKNWAELNGSIGGMMKNIGPEDNELEPAALAARKASQTVALVRLGVDEAKVSEILAKLRPTGRTAEAVASARRVAVVSTGLDYHPYRLHRGWQDLFEMVNDFEGSASDAEDMLAEWGARRRMHPLDAAVCSRASTTNETNLDTAFEVLDESHLIFDVSAVASDLADRELVDETFLNIPASYRRDFYIHFGANAFPSPYPHVGVEGAYVSRSEFPTEWGGDGLRDALAVKLVCSMPFRHLLDFEDVLLPQVWQNVRDHLRGPYFLFEPVEGGWVAEGIEYFKDQEEIESRAWGSFVERPIKAAINAIKALASNEYVVADAVLDAIEPEAAARLERATTDDKLLSSAAKLKDGQMLVRYLGRPAPSADVTSEATADYLPFHLRGDGAVQELLGDVRGYHGDRAPAVAKAMIDHILHNTAEGPEASFVVAECRAFMIRTLLAAIIYRGGRNHYKNPEVVQWRDEALFQIRDALRDYSSSSKMAMPLVWLAAHTLGFLDEAEAAWERAHEILAYQRNGVLEQLKALADEQIAENGEDFAAVVEYFMRPTYEQTATGNLRPHWDKWYTENDVMPRTPDLEAWLGEKAVPEPR